MNSIEENIQLKEQLRALQSEFDAWKRLHMKEILSDTYETLCYQQMECIMTLRKRLEERHRQCADLYKQLTSEYHS